jgi:hypothetical protein
MWYQKRSHKSPLWDAGPNWDQYPHPRACHKPWSACGWSCAILLLHALKYTRKKEGTWGACLPKEGKMARPCLFCADWNLYILLEAKPRKQTWSYSTKARRPWLSHHIQSFRARDSDVGLLRAPDKGRLTKASSVPVFAISLEPRVVFGLDLGWPLMSAPFCGMSAQVYCNMLTPGVFLFLL